MSTPESPGYLAEQKNSRRATRAPLIVEKIPCGDGRKTLFGYAKNVSCGGLFVSTVKPREPGEEFTLEFVLPTRPRHTIRCRCEVIWKRLYQQKSSLDPGMGLRFLDLSSADGEKLAEWVAAQTSGPAE